MIAKEAWLEEAAKFITLRREVLSAMSSLPQEAMPLTQEVIIDLNDPVLSCTGMDTILMDVVLQHYQADCKMKNLVVLFNAHEYLSSPSLLYDSLEHIAALGELSTTSIILSSPSPSKLPLDIFKELDYVICGLTRFSVCKVLQDQLFIKPPSLRWNSGRTMLIWSPESSRHKTIDEESDSSASNDPVKWGDKLVFMDVASLSVIPTPACTAMPYPGFSAEQRGMKEEEYSSAFVKPCGGTPRSSIQQYDVRSHYFTPVRSTAGQSNEVDIPVEHASRIVSPNRVHETKETETAGLATVSLLPFR